VAAVYLAGGWKAAILLEIGSEQAYGLAVKLMSIERPTSFDDNVRDSIGEIASMIAGNLKPLFPAETVLSMPSVVEGSQFTLRLIGGHERIRLEFDSDIGPFGLTLVRLVDS
jgi:CheY-specific phosphatase CheX